MPALARRADASPTDPASTDPAVRLPLGPLEDRVGFWLRLAQQAAFEAFHRRMAPLGLTPGRMALLLLLEEGPDRRQAEIAEALRIKPSNLAVLAGGLEAEGLIRRVEDPRDRRAVRLRLTPAGRALLRRAKQQEAQVEADLAARLDPATRTMLLDALRRIAGA